MDQAEIAAELEQWRDAFATCLEQSGDKWDNDPHMVMERIDERLRALLRQLKGARDV